MKIVPEFDILIYLMNFAVNVKKDGWGTLEESVLFIYASEVRSSFGV